MPRGSKPGERRGGRQKGTPNKRSSTLRRAVSAREILAAIGCDPIEGLALIAMDEKTELDLKVRCYAELAAYIHPRLKAVETTVMQSSSAQTVVFEWGDEEQSEIEPKAPEDAQERAPAVEPGSGPARKAIIN